MRVVAVEFVWGHAEEHGGDASRFDLYEAHKVLDGEQVGREW